jgi:hypothetical protein
MQPIKSETPGREIYRGFLLFKYSKECFGLSSWEHITALHSIYSGLYDNVIYLIKNKFTDRYWSLESYCHQSLDLLRALRNHRLLD